MRFSFIAILCCCIMAGAQAQSTRKGVDSVTVYPSPALGYKVIDGDSFALVVPGPQYRAGAVKRILGGRHYRKAWNTPIWVPVLQTHEHKGGLTYYKRGGNKQTFVVNVRDTNEEIFTIRSMQKNPIRALPMHQRNSLIGMIARDQVSSMHPTAVFIIPDLAEALKIYHTHPELFYITSDTALRDAQSLLAGRLVMVEEKYEGKFKLPGFKGDVKSFKTDSVMELRRLYPGIKVDQRNLLRARLLDMIIGDWDRSEDQWKWLLKSSNDSTGILLPVPRDRDQAMVLMDGVMPWLYSQEFISRKYQGFRKGFHDIIGLNWNARTFDRNFLNELTKEDWAAEADSVKRILTDELLEKALMKMPEEHRKIDGPTILHKLKRRRDAIDKVALKYYKLIAEDLILQGSVKSDVFKVKRFAKDSLLVEMFNPGDTLKPVYSRTVRTDDTEEVLIYGNNGDDKLVLEGRSNEAIVVRFIGGFGIDTVIDRSFVKGIWKNTKVYDLKDSIRITASAETKDMTNYDVRVNDFTSREYIYDSYSPKLILEYNDDQGMLAGFGFSYTHEEFRKKPYAFFQEMSFAKALYKQGFYITSKTDFVNLFGKLGLKVDMFLYPSFITSFYGFGNETELRGLDYEFYKMRMNRTHISPIVYRPVNDKVKVGIGLEYSRHTVFPDSMRYISGFLGYKEIHQEFGSVKFEYLFSNKDYFNKDKGFEWKTFAQSKFAITKGVRNFSKLGSEASAYYRFKSMMFPVIAARIGAVTNFDQFPFYESAFIGGYNFEKENETVRGFRRNRFAGRSSVYNNYEIRLRLLTFGYSGEGGIFGFYDLGRVWYDGEDSHHWHSGVGGGIWLKPFQKLMFTFTSAHSKEESLFNFDMGFFF